MKMCSRSWISICCSFRNIVWVIERVKAASRLAKMAIVETESVSWYATSCQLGQRTNRSAFS